MKFEKNFILEKCPIRFILVGILNTFLGYGVFIGLYYLGLAQNMAMFFATLFGVLFNFKSIGTFVFGVKDNKHIYKFTFLYLNLYFANIYIMSLINMGLHNIYLSGAGSILLCSLASYFANKHFVFNPKFI